MINKRHPSVVHLILNDLTQDRPSYHLSALVQAKDRLADVGFHPPSLAALGATDPAEVTLKTEGQACPDMGGNAKLPRRWRISCWPHLCVRLQNEVKGHVEVPRRSMVGLPFMCSRAPGAPPVASGSLCPLLCVPASVAVLRPWPPPCSVRKRGRAAAGLRTGKRNQSLPRG